MASGIFVEIKFPMLNYPSFRVRTGWGDMESIVPPEPQQDTKPKNPTTYGGEVSTFVHPNQNPKVGHHTVIPGLPKF